MKKALIILALFCSSAHAQMKDQDKADKINLHLSQYDREVKEASVFVATGLGIAASSTVLILGKSKDRFAIAGSMVFIGTAFTTYGFIELFNSSRHLKKVRWLESGIAVK